MITDENLSNCKILRLILWTNWQTSRRKFGEVFCVLICPSVFCFALLMTQIVFENPKDISLKYEPINLHDQWKVFINKMLQREEIIHHHKKISITRNPFTPQLAIGYAPNIFKAFTEIMNNATKNYLDNILLYGFETCEVLREQQAKNFYIAGICFDESTMNLETETIYMVRGFPTYLSFAIIYPREVRIYDDTYIGNSWETGTYFDTTDMYDQRNEDQNDGGYIGYIREGFASIQNAISMAYIRLAEDSSPHNDNDSINISDNNTGINDDTDKRKAIEFPQIFMQRYPYFKSQYTTTSGRLASQLPIVTMCGYLCSTIILTKMLYEHKSKYKNLHMSKLGMKRWLQFLAWLIEGTFLLAMASLLQIIILKIHWYKHDTMWPKASITALLFFLTAYSVSALCFCYMISAFFSNSALGIVVTSMSFIVTIFPSLWVLNRGIRFRLHTHNVLCFIFSNAIMGHSYNDILEFEELNSGFGWESYIDGNPIDRKLTLGFFVAIFYGVGIIYTLIGLYVLYLRETLHIAECIKTFLQYVGIFKLPKGHNVANRESITRFSYLSKVFQIKSVLEKATVQINNLTKMYDGTEVVHDLSTDLYENEITVLMGHNGAGKTTLLYMLAGMIKPSSGTIKYYHFKLRQYVKDSARSLCYAMHDDVLFDDLTPKQQLHFFCCMKAIPNMNIKDECEKYINAMNLHAWINKRTKNLPFGVRKQLALCCALIGGSRIVLLDEPSAGVDIYLRKLIWDLLAKEKHGRTILLTSHSMTEAEAVGDRVMILCKGELKCDGSSYFLKHIYGSPLRLICAKRDNCLTENVTKAIAKLIPDIRLDSELGTEICYIIDNKHLEIIENLLTQLEQQYESLSLERCYIQECSIEDIFYKMGAEHPSHGYRQRHQEIMNGQSLYIEEYDKLEFITDFQRSKGLQRFCMLLKTMLRKHFINMIRKKPKLIVSLLMPIIVVCFLQRGGMTTSYLLKPASLTFNLLDYNKSITILERQKNLKQNTAKIANEYSEMLSLLGSDNKFLTLKDQTFEEYILDKQYIAKDRINHLYLIGATMRNDSIIAWFNNYPLHTAPLSLNLIHRAMIRTILNKHARISVTIENLPYNAKLARKLSRNSTSKFTYFFYFLSFSVCFILTISVLDLINEKKTQFKLQQFISGARLFTFYLSIFISDIIKMFVMILVTILTVLVIALILGRDLTGLSFSAYIAAAMLYGAACILPFNYLLSLFFDDYILGYIVISNIGSFSICCFFVVDNSYARGFNEILVTIFIYHMIPYFSFCSLLLKLARVSYRLHICELQEIQDESIILDQCQNIPHCCKEKDIFHWHKDGAGKDITALLLVAILSWSMIWLFETRKMRKRTNLFISIPKEDLSSARAEHERIHSKREDSNQDLLYEKVKVKFLKPQDFRTTPIICDSISKNCFKKKVIEKTHLLLDRTDVFGIMGVSGSGKSTLLKMLVGALKMSFGRVYIEGLPLNEDLYKVYERIGYCPQYDELPKHFRVREIMELFCTLRGVTANQVHDMCESAAKVLGFYAHYNKIINICTNGIKRRISCAIAMLGNPSVVFLDEPERNIDAAGKRELWNIIQKIQKNGKTIIMATLSAQACEIVCNRITIISKGCFLMLDKPFNLDSSLFNKGYILRVKMKRIIQQNLKDSFKAVESFIKAEFPSAVLKSRHGYMSNFFIPVGSTTAGQIYKIMQMNAFLLHIEDFVLSRTHISTIFMDAVNKTI